MSFGAVDSILSVFPCFGLPKKCESKPKEGYILCMFDYLGLCCGHESGECFSLF